MTVPPISARASHSPSRSAYPQTERKGTYYPEFSLSFRDANSLFSRQMVQIDSTPLVISVVDKPDAFAAGKKKTLYLQVANPRKNDVKNAILDISGDGSDRNSFGDIYRGHCSRCQDTGKLLGHPGKADDRDPDAELR